MADEARRLVIVCLTSDRQPALLARARALAEAAQLDVYVYRPLPDPVALASLKPGEAAAEAHAEAFGRAADELQHMLEWLAAQGLVADGKVEWQASPVPATLALIAELDPQLVLLGPGQKHNKVGQILRSDDDFELIRRCPAPLWLARRYPSARNVILAAIDPTHREDAANAIDHAIVDTALTLAEQLGGMQVHIVHTYTRQEHVPEMLAATLPAAAADGRNVDNCHAKQVHQIARAHNVDVAHVHISTGTLPEVIGPLIESMGVDVIVLGALSRNALKRMLVGGTAEKLLRAVDADILVVKALQTR